MTTPWTNTLPTNIRTWGDLVGTRWGQLTSLHATWSSLSSLTGWTSNSTTPTPIWTNVNT